MSVHELWHGKPPNWKPKGLKNLGRVGIVKIKDSEGKGTPMIIVGYVRNAPVETYRMFNPKTKRATNTDSVAWTKFSVGKLKRI